MTDNSKDKAPKVRRVQTPVEEVDRMFSEMFGRDWPKSWIQPFQWNLPAWSATEAPRGTRFPRVDIIDRREDILIKANVPGVAKDDLDISVSDRTLTLSGVISGGGDAETGNVYRMERLRGRFSRTLALPSVVDGDKAVARLEDGVLTLTLPKHPHSHHRNIPVE